MYIGVRRGAVYTPTERRTATVCELRDRALIMARGSGGYKTTGGGGKFYPYKRKGGRFFVAMLKGVGGGGGVNDFEQFYHGSLKF